MKFIFKALIKKLESSLRNQGRRIMEARGVTRPPPFFTRRVNFTKILFLFWYCKILDL
ncbi:hypothetical protein Hdeb2414_s0006g00218911 [Helianthus debilis subsp. tardiflorus]